MKFVVLGAGAMGCLYGARLKRIGEDVTFIDVNKPHMDAINENGLLAHFDSGDEYLKIPALLAQEYHEVADAVIVFTKSTFSKAALDSLKSAFGPDTILISFQNGLGHDKLMANYASDGDHIIIGTTNFPSDLIGNGEFANHGKGVTRMMTVSGKITPALEAVKASFQKAGLEPELTDDVFSAVWEKAAFNAALNSLCSVTIIPQGYLGQTAEGKELAHTIVKEAAGVAKAKGIRFDLEHVLNNVDTLFTAHFDHCPSMEQDVLNKRLTEIDFINGAIVREAEALGMQVPVTKTLYYLVSILQSTYEHRLLNK